MGNLAETALLGPKSFHTRNLRRLFAAAEFERQIPHGHEQMNRMRRRRRDSRLAAMTAAATAAAVATATFLGAGRFFARAG